MPSRTPSQEASQKRSLSGVPKVVKDVFAGTCGEECRDAFSEEVALYPTMKQ